MRSIRRLIQTNKHISPNVCRERRRRAAGRRRGEQEVTRPLIRRAGGGGGSGGTIAPLSPLKPSERRSSTSRLIIKEARYISVEVLFVLCCRASRKLSPKKKILRPCLERKKRREEFPPDEEDARHQLKRGTVCTESG